MRAPAAALLMLLLTNSVHAEPVASPSAENEERVAEPSALRTGVALGLTAGTAVGAWVLVSQAWWSDGPKNDHLVFRDEGGFGLRTYAGGADKLGHVYSSYVATRSYAHLLEWGGFSRATSTVAATAITALFFTSIELKDGYEPEYGFSWGDLASNTTGQALALGVLLVPGLNRVVSFKLLYFPSPEFRRAFGTPRARSVPEDYSGQTYLIAFHLAALPVVPSEPVSFALRYVDVSLGFATRGFEPRPVRPEPVRQIVSLGLSLNVTSLLEDAFGPRPGDAGGALMVASDALQPPFTRVAFGVERRGPPLPAEE